jgi:hypothetical protein
MKYELREAQFVPAILFNERSISIAFTGVTPLLMPLRIFTLSPCAFDSNLYFWTRDVLLLLFNSLWEHWMRTGGVVYIEQR